MTRRRSPTGRRCSREAPISDIGGESTRPGAGSLDPAEEARRIEPVIREVAYSGALVSIDSRNASTLRAAVAAGARIINDVSALAGDPESIAVAAQTRSPVVLMHMRGDPRTMRDDPVYACAPLDVLEYLETRIAAGVGAGIARSSIVIDPGIDFGSNRSIIFS